MLIIGLEMLLVDTLKLEKYYAPCVSEVVGVVYQGFCIFGAHTQSHFTAPMFRGSRGWTPSTAENEGQISRVSAHWVLDMLYGDI